MILISLPPMKIVKTINFITYTFRIRCKKFLEFCVILKKLTESYKRDYFLAAFL